jgi:hypothetical protein
MKYYFQNHSFPTLYPANCPCCGEPQPTPSGKLFLELPLETIFTSHLKRAWRSTAPVEQEWKSKESQRKHVGLNAKWYGNFIKVLPYCQTCKEHIRLKGHDWDLFSSYSFFVVAPVSIISMVLLQNLFSQIGLIGWILGVIAILTALQCFFWLRRVRYAEKATRAMKPNCTAVEYAVIFSVNHGISRKESPVLRTQDGYTYTPSLSPNRFSIVTTNRKWAEMVAVLNNNCEFSEERTDHTFFKRLAMGVVVLLIAGSAGAIWLFRALKKQTEIVANARMTIVRKESNGTVQYQLYALPNSWSKPIAVPTNSLDMDVQTYHQKRILVLLDGKPMDTSRPGGKVGSVYQFKSASQETVPVEVIFKLK